MVSKWKQDWKSGFLFDFFWQWWRSKPRIRICVFLLFYLQGNISNKKTNVLWLSYFWAFVTLMHIVYREEKPSDVKNVHTFPVNWNDQCFFFSIQLKKLILHAYSQSFAKLNLCNIKSFANHTWIEPLTTCWSSKPLASSPLRFNKTQSIAEQKRWQL